MNAYVVSHNGMGDNLYMIGGLRYLTNFYDKVYFICKQKYYSNISLFFSDEPKIICLPVHNEKECDEIKTLFNNKFNDPNDNDDLFVCGHRHKQNCTPRINNKSFSEHKRPDNKYNIDFDTITTRNYYFLLCFYSDLRLNIGIYFDYFKVPQTEESINLYNSIKHFEKIIFIQLKCSQGKCLNIQNLKDKYYDKEDTILICNDMNLYDKDSDNENIQKKYQLSSKFVFNKLVYYLDTIKNSDEIYIIDSCFVGMILPLVKTNQLKADPTRIILRGLSHLHPI